MKVHTHGHPLQVWHLISPTCGEHEQNSAVNDKHFALSGGKILKQLLTVSGYMV